MSQPIPNYDASFCGRLPLHQTNLIQPHGVLLVLNAHNLEVQQVSENISALNGWDAAAIVGQTVHQLMDEASLQHLLQAAESGGAERETFALQLLSADGPQRVSAALHRKDDGLLLEIMLPGFGAAQHGVTEAYNQIRNVMAQLGRQTELDGFVAAVAREIRAITGFDKVMVYSFNEEWHGTVLAEEKVAEMPAYLGLRFPASDIPKPARDLYLKNPYRVIPNRAYQPVKIYPLLNPHTNTFTDLSGCDLRSVAAVHLEYMKNMEIDASLSLRLVHEGKLWGLISCHHRTARYFSFEELGMFELLSGMISAQLSIVLNRAAGDRLKSLQAQLTALVPGLHNSASLHESLRQHAGDVMSLLNGEGLAFNFNGHIETIGKVPDQNDLDRLFYWLQVQEPGQVVHVPSLPRTFEEAAAFAQVGSGILALPVVPQNGNFVVAFRPEAIEEVAWGGNPHEALQFESDGKTYHPRHSFGVWKQTVKHTARPWDGPEIVIAEALKNVLGGIVLRRLHA